MPAVCCLYGCCRTLKLAIEDAVDVVCATPDIGEMKTGGRPRRNCMTMLMTAEDLYAEMEQMPSSERTRFFLMLASKAFREDDYTHDQAWHFRRDSGLSTAYIGPANMSHAAMTSGLEWNLKVIAFDSKGM